MGKPYCGPKKEGWLLLGWNCSALQGGGWSGFSIAKKAEELVSGCLKIDLQLMDVGTLMG